MNESKQQQSGNKKRDRKTEPSQSSKLDRLANELSETNKILRHVYSWQAVVLRGLLFGLATVVGTTVLAGIAVSVFEVFTDVPFI